jgi:uncharacterized protein YeaO (DUF488 family)
MIKIRRVYEAGQADGGASFLVERLWPRGFKKEDLKMQAWVKEAAPSQALRAWYAHDVTKWDEFQQRYRAELDAHPERWQLLLDAARQGNVTLLYSARDTEHNSAVLLRVYLQEKLTA